MIALERIGNVSRLAVIENGQLCEYYSERKGGGALSGNIYVGRVQNVLPGMNAAFVDIGLKKNAYLPMQEGARKLSVKPGELILCRVVKEPGGSKGPMISCEISVPGRLCAILPGLEYVGVSKKIEDEECRDGLYAAAKAFSEGTGIGIIVRTAAAEESEQALKEDYDSAVTLWHRIETEAKACPGPRLLYADGDLALFAVRELLDDSVTCICADDEDSYERIVSAVHRTAPRFEDLIERWQGETPLFDVLRVDHQLDEALRRQVRLKNGGTIVIDETEALTVIDVNTGKFTGKKDLQSTILKTDLEAADEIARQLRLRELGGIIIVDFIDLESEADRVQLIDHLNEALRADRVRAKVAGMTDLGLVEITRKKVYRPLSKRMLRQCSCCKGEGTLLTQAETALRLARQLNRRRRTGDTSAYALRATEDILNVLRADHPRCAADVELITTQNADEIGIEPFAKRNEDKTQ